MRYTLRLLTADQFRRSAALICALEFIRRNKILSSNLGQEEISLGLWIGGEASPKTHKEAGSWMTNEKNLTKIRIINLFYMNARGANPT